MQREPSVERRRPAEQVLRAYGARARVASRARLADSFAFDADGFEAHGFDVNGTKV